VSEVGGARTGKGNLLVPRIQQGIDLAGERLHLLRQRRSQTLGSSGADSGKPRPYRLQRSETDSHLRPKGPDEKQGDDDEKRREIGAEVTGQFGKIRHVACDDHPHRPAPKSGREYYTALDRKQRRAARPGNPMLVYSTLGQFVRRERQLKIPQRARARDNLVGLLRHLPVEPRQRPVEPRITRLFRDGELAFGVAVDSADEIVEHYRQIGRHPPLDMPFEQQHQAEGGQAERDQYRHDPGEEQPQPQRAHTHVPGSGTR
jgi:hypothetical protein